MGLFIFLWDLYQGLKFCLEGLPGAVVGRQFCIVTTYEKDVTPIVQKKSTNKFSMSRVLNYFHAEIDAASDYSGTFLPGHFSVPGQASHTD